MQVSTSTQSLASLIAQQSQGTLSSATPNANTRTALPGKITAGVHATAASTPSSTTAASDSSSSSTITANDFLTLLVAEMKNQDPTSTNDPNQYISQLVQVNSLQQLIQINQDLGASSAGASSTGSTASRVPATGRVAPAAVNAGQEKEAATGNLSPGSAATGQSQSSALALATALSHSRDIPQFTPASVPSAINPLSATEGVPR